MTTSLDDLEVVLRCERTPSTSIRFAERNRVEDGRLFFLVEARALGIDAKLERVTNFVVGTALARFLEDLDVRGWEGEREWVNSDRDLRVGAVYSARGHIGLTWSLRPWRRSVSGEWTASVTTWIEAGAAKDRLAADLHTFLSAEGFDVDYVEAPIDMFTSD